MVHCSISSAWRFSTRPSPGFRIDPEFGARSGNHRCLPVQGVAVKAWYRTIKGDGRELYLGNNEAMAEQARTDWNRSLPKNTRPPGVFIPMWERPARVITWSSLPAGKFRVAKSKNRGFVITSGRDRTNRCLFFIDISIPNQVNAHVGILPGDNDGQVLKTFRSGRGPTACAAAVVLKPGQSVVLHLSGYRMNEVYVYTWTGERIDDQHWSKGEWDRRHTPAVRPTELRQVFLFAVGGKPLPAVYTSPTGPFDG